MATKTPRIMIGLKCDECKEINFTKTKNPKNTKDSLKIKKYCPKCKKHTIHSESKLK